MFNRNIGFVLIAFISLLFYSSCVHEPLEILPDIPGGGGTAPPPPVEEFCDEDTVYFQNDILPLIVSHCAISGCHDAVTHREGYNMSTYESLMSEDDLIDPFDPDNSELYEVLFESGDDKMPPAGEDQLTSAEKQLIEDWINQGALNNECSECDSIVTYSLTIAPIIESYCLGCHSGSGPSGGIDLSDYIGVADVAENGSLYGAVNHEAGYEPMPYGGSWLLQCQIDQILTWIENGFPED